MTEEVEQIPLSIIARNLGKRALAVYLHTHSTIVGGNTWSLSHGLPICVHIGQGEKLPNPRNRYHCHPNPYEGGAVTELESLGANVRDRSMGTLTR